MPNNKPILIIIAGPNGSGKTATTQILRTRYPQWTKDAIEVNPDYIAEQEFGSWNDPVSIRKAAQRADEIRESCLRDRKNLLFETVLSIPAKVDFIRRAKKEGYFVRLIYVATENPEINMLRVAWRVEQGGHTVPEDKIRTRYDRSLKLALEVALLVDRAYFIDNSQNIESSAQLAQPLPIFRTAEGKVAKTYLQEKDFPLWIKPIYRELPHL